MKIKVTWGEEDIIAVSLLFVIDVSQDEDQGKVGGGKHRHRPM